MLSPAFIHFDFFYTSRNGAYRTDIGAQAVTVTPCIYQVVTPESADGSAVSAKSPVNGAYAFMLHAGPYAPAAHDAFIWIDGDIGMAVVHRQLTELFTETLCIQLYLEESRDVLQFAILVCRAGLAFDGV